MSVGSGSDNDEAGRKRRKRDREVKKQLRYLRQNGCNLLIPEMCEMLCP